MKINKLVLSSVAALALAGAFAPVADAAYYSETTGKHYETLVNVPEKVYDDLLNELTTNIITVKSLIGLEGSGGATEGSSGLILEVKEAKDALATAQETANTTAVNLEKALADYNEALAAFEAAETEHAELQTAVTAMKATYGEYEQKRTAVEQAYEYSVNQAHEAYREATIGLDGPVKEAQEAVYYWQEQVNILTVDFSALPEDTQETEKAKLANAESELLKAEQNLVTAQTTYDEAIPAAADARDAAIDKAEGIRTTALYDIEEVFNETSIYGEYGTIEAAEAALTAAASKVDSTRMNLQSMKEDYDLAVSRNNEAQVDLRTKQLALAAAQAELSDAYADKAYYEANLHELVVGQSYYTDASRGNLTQEQQDLVEEISGLTSEQLAEQLAKAKADAEAAKKHAEELRNQDGEPGDGEPGDGEPGDGEPGDGEPGDGEPGDGEPGDGDDNGTPVKPGTPAKPAAGSGAGKAQLPETGESSAFAIYGAAALSVLAGVGLIAKKREEA